MSFTVIVINTLPSWQTFSVLSKLQELQLSLSLRHCAAHKWKLGVPNSFVMKLAQEELVMFIVFLNIMSCKGNTWLTNKTIIAALAVIAKLLNMDCNGIGL